MILEKVSYVVKSGTLDNSYLINSSNKFLVKLKERHDTLILTNPK